MAIEDMYMSKDCLQGLIDVANGTKQGVTEELLSNRWQFFFSASIQEVIKLRV